MTNSERVALLRATGEEILSGEVVVDDREGQLMVWAADTIATLTRERDEARANAERLQAVRDDCVRNEAALIADRDALKAKAEAADAELPPLPEGWREVPTCGAVRTYMCVNHAYRYVEVFLDGTVRISWALDLPTAITVLRHAEQAHQELKEGK